jgi:hypothetical protein
MRKLLILLPLLMVPISGLAQETPKVQIFTGYSNMWASFNANDFDLNGFNISAQENLNSWFGGVLDFSTHFGSENGFKTNVESLSYGPVFTYRKNKTVIPFAHAMVGVERGGTNYLNISQPEERLALLGGGGIDFRLRHNVYLRLVQVDYVESQFSNTRQNNLRISGGLIFNLGWKKHEKNIW